MGLRLEWTADGNFTCLISTVGLAVAMDTMIDLRFLSKLGACLVYSYSITPLRVLWGSHFTYCHVHQQFSGDVDLVLFLDDGDVLLNKL